MKATRKTIPTLAAKREPFTNGSGTLRAVKNPNRELIQSLLPSLPKSEATTLEVHFELNGITYIVLSYESPIAWEVKTGYVYKTKPHTLSQTSRSHLALLDMFTGKEAERDTPED